MSKHTHRAAIALATGLLAGMSAPVSAAAVIWQGAAVIEEISSTYGQTCTQSGSRLAVGQTLRLIFRPRGIGDNGIDTYLIFLDLDKTASMRLGTGEDFVGNLPDGPSGPHVRVISEAGAVTYGGSVEGASVTPAVFNSATKTLALAGWVESIFAACKFRFRANVMLRP